MKFLVSKPRGMGNMVGLRDNKLKLTSRETIQQLIGKGFVACVWGGVICIRYGHKTTFQW